MQKHYEVCPEMEVDCPFHSQGCLKGVKRRLLSQHMAEASGKHMGLLKESFEHQSKLLVKKFEVLLRQRDDRIQVLEAKIRKMRLEKTQYTLIWNIPRWDQVCREEDFVKSKPFTINGFTFFFGIWPQGESQKGFISLYLYLDQSSKPKGYSITIDFSVAIINQAHPMLTVAKQYESISFPLATGQGWGDPVMLKTSMANAQRGFVGNDGIFTIQSAISVKNQLFSL